MRLTFIFFGLAILVILPFLIWGERVEAILSPEWVAGFGGWAWAVGLALLVGDVFLPLPATAVMAGLGFVYGAFVGGVLAVAGSFLSGVLAYSACRLLGGKAARFLAGEDDLRRGEILFRDSGGWIVAVSRWLPVFPEVIACMAGLMKMPPRRFLLALACGSLPLGFTFAAIGATGREVPGLAIAVSALLPPLLWLVAKRWIDSR